jgi:hypothetical protein
LGFAVEDIFIDVGSAIDISVFEGIEMVIGGSRDVDEDFSEMVGWVEIENGF